MEQQIVPVLLTTTMKGDNIIIAYKINETEIKKQSQKWHIVVTSIIDDLWFQGVSFIKTKQNSVLLFLFFICLWQHKWIGRRMRCECFRLMKAHRASTRHAVDRTQ